MIGMFAAMFSATIFGIPIGALIAYQFGWRCAYTGLAVASAFAAPIGSYLGGIIDCVL